MVFTGKCLTLGFFVASICPATIASANTVVHTTARSSLGKTCSDVDRDVTARECSSVMDDAVPTADTRLIRNRRGLGDLFDFGKGPSILGSGASAFKNQSGSNVTENPSSLNVTHDVLWECLQSNSLFTMFGQNGTLALAFRPKGIIFEYSRKSCEFEIIVPEEQIVQLELLNRERGCGMKAKWMVFDTFGRKPLAKANCGSHLPTIYSFSRSLTIQMTLKLLVVDAPRELFFRFKAVSASERPGLEINFTSNTTGYVQSPGWDGRVEYMRSADSWLKLPVPPGHVIMTSFLSFDVGFPQGFLSGGDRLHIFKGSNSTEDMYASFSGVRRPLPRVYETDVLYLRFITDENHSSDRDDVTTGNDTGFKMIFSFHPHSARPERLPDGKWNCSVPHWTAFQQHFPCDGYPDCANSEDEADCVYTTEKCGLGFITAGNSCHFLLLRLTGVRNGNQASAACQQHGARLSSINTAREREDILQALRVRSGDQFYVGLSSASTSQAMYRNMYQWEDGTIAYLAYIQTDYNLNERGCGVLHTVTNKIYIDRCSERSSGMFKHQMICEVSPAVPRNDGHVPAIPIQRPPSATFDTTYVTCPQRHVTRSFLACDVRSMCWAEGNRGRGSCDAPLTPLPPSFICKDEVSSVPYTLVCDHRSDCGDGSDETFCVFSPCGIGQLSCGDRQCVLEKQWCDRVPHCVNGADENRCHVRYVSKLAAAVPPPAVIDWAADLLNTADQFIARPIKNYSLQNDSHVLCPETHFQCADDGFCMPVYMRCNGVFDCPGKEDETDCEVYVCPGLYRCRGSNVCVHPNHTCDGVHHCPLRDDELLCEAACPDVCTCYGLAFYCQLPFPVHDYPDLRFLDAGGSGTAMVDVKNNSLLVYLSLSRCGLRELHQLSLYNLQTLDVSDNDLRVVSETDFKHLHNLRSLSLARNPLTSMFESDVSSEKLLFNKMQQLSLSGVVIEEFDVAVLAAFPNLALLNLSKSDVQRIVGKGFLQLPHLNVLDVRGCPIETFPRDLFKDLDDLRIVYSDSYKLCCPAMLPAEFNLVKCHAPSDEISSCQALLRSNVYRISLAGIAALALLGNLTSFIFRVVLSKKNDGQGFSVFVTNLCVADFLMGVYLAVIGVADALYQGTYLWEDLKWRRSAACKVAGFVSLVSNEVSAFMICLITLDRFLVLRFPLSQIHFRRKSAYLACAVAWVLGVILASVPLVPMTSHWQFYSQTGICIPLPITRTEFPGQSYSFGVMIILNFVLFLLIAAGQAVIFWSVRANRMPATDSSRKFTDLTIARRLITIAMSDFLCWFPIGLLGILASSGKPIPGEFNVAVAIFVLPLNSALNPFLYTLNKLAERRRQVMEERLRKQLLADLRLKYPTNSGYRGHDAKVQ